MLTPILKLSGSNRRVWFLSEDGETISHIIQNQKIYKIQPSDQTQDTNTWRPIQVDDVDKLTDSTTSINFKAGDNVTLSYENGTLTISASDMDTTYQVAVASVDGVGGSSGLMAAQDKERLDKSSLESAEVTNADTDISLTLANNTVYSCTSDAISSLTISGVVNEFKYATIIFRSPGTATTFVMPDSGYYCTGSGCSAGVFTPEASKRYSMAINQEFDGIVIYVVEVA